MSRNHLLLCLFGISIFFVVCTVAHEAIVGGHKAAVGQFPYHVTVTVTGYDECGGCIIGKYHILTAAHCVIRTDNQFIKLRNLTIVAGINDLRQKVKPIKVKKIFVPQEFNGSHSANVTSHDIAVLKLRWGLKLSNNKNLQKLELSKNDSVIDAGPKVRFSGFGWHWVNLDRTKKKVLHGGNDDTILRYSKADMIDNEECQREYSKDNVAITEKEICAKLESYYDMQPHGACKGDSGGALVYNGTIAVGILTRGSPICDEIKKASIYTRVSYYQNFIQQAMEGKHTPNIRVHPRSFF